MRIAFLTRDYGAVFFLEVAKRLTSNYDWEVYWITNNKIWRDYFIANMVCEEKIIYIPTYLGGKAEQKTDFRVIDYFEKVFADFNISKWIFADRALCDVDYECAKEMLSFFSDELHNILRKNRFDYVVGELTFAIELVTYYIAKHVGTHYLWPLSIRVPSTRFAFFETPYQGGEFLKRNPTDDHYRLAEDVYEKWKKNREKPYDWYISMNIPKLQISWLYKFFRWMNESDYISSNVRLLAKKKVSETFNRITMKSVRFYKLEELNKKMTYALFPLHKQPESSVDVVAPEFSNQLYIIENIARSLPHNFCLLVKEHATARGDRARGFYNKLQKMGNVVLLDPFEDSYSAIERSDLVLTISGTMGYEAALLGKPVITFSKVFFSQLRNVVYCHDLTRLSSEIKKAVNSDPLSQDEGIRFIAWTIANSYKGVRGNPRTDMSIMDKGNLDNWADGFISHAKVN